MNPSPPAETPILVVEQDESLRETFVEVLAEGGYAATVVSSLAEAYQHIDMQTYALVLTDLYVGRSPYEFSEAHRLRRRASPTPLGLLTTQAISPEEAKSAGFAFCLCMPFDLDELLGYVAATVNQPFTPEQRERAEVVQRYFAALEAGDWMTVLSLCSDDVTYYPPRDSLLTTSRRLSGKSTLLAYLRSSPRHYQHVAFTSLRLYPCPKGIVARFNIAWTSSDEYWQQAAETTRFHFDGSHVRQVGVRVYQRGAVVANRTAG